MPLRGFLAESLMSTADANALCEELIDLVKRHDFFFHYSDDYRVVQQGRSEEARIRYLVEVVPNGKQIFETLRKDRG